MRIYLVRSEERESWFSEYGYSLDNKLQRADAIVEALGAIWPRRKDLLVWAGALELVNEVKRGETQCCVKS